MTTVIVAKNMIAADSLLSRSNEVYDINCGSVRKIVVYGNAVVGFAGSYGLLPDAVKYIFGMLEEKPEGSWTILKLHEDGSIVEHYGDVGFTTSIPSPAVAGTGGVFAKAAYLAGAGPIQAIQVASEIDLFSGGSFISWYDIKEKKGECYLRLLSDGTLEEV